MIYAPFWDVTRRRLVVSYRRFGATYRSYLQGSSTFSANQSLPIPFRLLLRTHVPKCCWHCSVWPFKMGRMGCPENSVTTKLRWVISRNSEDFKDRFIFNPTEDRGTEENRETLRRNIQPLFWDQWRTQEFCSERRGGSTNSVQDRGQRERGSGGGGPLVRGSA
jgi:hypothetical protein